MRILIASDDPLMATQLRLAIVRLRPESVIVDMELRSRLDVFLDSNGDDVALLLVVLPSTVDAECVSLLKRIRSRCRARVVVVGQTHSPRQLVEFLHAGADDFLDDEADLSAEMTAVLHRVPTQSTSAVPEGEVISIVSAAGGGGTTLTAANLAVLATEHHADCGVIDLASQRGELSASLGLKPRHSLSELCASLETPDPETFRNSLTIHSSHARLIASRAAGDDSQLESPQSVERIIHTARRVHAVTVVDLSIHQPWVRQVLEASDEVVLLVSRNFNAACNARHILDEWNAWGIELGRVRVVTSRCGQLGEISADKIGMIIGRSVDAILPEDPLHANLSVNCGNPVVLEFPKSPLSKAYKVLAELIWKSEQLGKESSNEVHETRTRSRRPLEAPSLWRKAAGMIFSF